MGVGALISVDEYLRTSYHPDRDFIEGEVLELPVPVEEIFTSPPYLCVEVMSPDDTIAAMQDRLDDYLQFGVPNVWVIDPYFNKEGKHRGWHVTAEGWATAIDGVMRSADKRIAMPLVDVLLP